MDNGEELRIRPLIVLMLVLILLTSLAFFIVRYVRSYTYVTLTPRSGTTIEIGKPGGDSESSTPLISETLAKTSSPQTIKLKKGSYIVKFSGTDYEDTATSQYFSASTEIQTPALNLNKEKLHTVLVSNQPQLHKAVLQTPGVSNYSIAYESVYADGSWYAAHLTPKNPATALDLRVILHKDNGKWVVVSSPQTTFYLGDLPSVPENLVRDVNNH